MAPQMRQEQRIWWCVNLCFDSMKVHLIAIGGSAMHNLAIALFQKGLTVTGSDDEIFEPSKSRLAHCQLLPEEEGWFPEKIRPDLDAVIVGMHARADNPELLEAQKWGLKIYSYPEYIYHQTATKKRVVIGGSHGKTTTTSMILHVLKEVGLESDYLVGAQLEGFDCMVRLSETSSIAVIEGDEYLSSPIDRRPKFHLYQPDIAVITGIAWDHINVFPTFENYVEQFKIFTDKIATAGTLIFCAEDQHVMEVAAASPEHLSKIAYGAHPHVVRDGVTYLLTPQGEVALRVFGAHNMQNLQAAMHVCLSLGVEASQFYQAIASFKGASKRLEPVLEKKSAVIFKDFAHSPSKLKATTAAFKQQYPTRRLIACMELHTFSSLNKAFLHHYENSMDVADVALVYFNPHTLQHKKLEAISEEEVALAFASDNVKVYTDAQAIVRYLQSLTWDQTNLLLMTSGNFDGLDFKALAADLIGEMEGA
jgi:UDP-N-acetylmuramate: L-alanyl-gamma-D-glutamyl-meso-diaminopimelate ligase